MPSKRPDAPELPAEHPDHPFTVRPEQAADGDWIEALHVRCFGPGRLARAAFRVREQIEPELALCLIAEFDGKPVASVRMTPIAVGGEPGYLLGPLATEPEYRGRGAGRWLARQATEAAMQKSPAGFVLLVGDEPYFAPLGYRRVSGAIPFPGPVDPARILVHCDAALVARLEGPVGARAR